jgi:hypothetical protein
MRDSMKLNKPKTEESNRIISSEFKEMIKLFHSTKSISNKEIIELSKKKKTSKK